MRRDELIKFTDVHFSFNCINKRKDNWYYELFVQNRYNLIHLYKMITEKKQNICENLMCILNIIDGV